MTIWSYLGGIDYEKDSYDIHLIIISFINYSH